MITVVNLNPCLDWSWQIGDFTPGGMNRVQSTRADVAGKGINVCMALKNLGADPLCLGFNFTENGSAITHKLDEMAIRHDFVRVKGAVRINIKLYDNAGAMTELNQAGAFVADSAQAVLFEKIMSWQEGREGGLLVLSGSRPANVPADFYARICNAWQGRVILDTEGEALKLALAQDNPPFLLKPNLFELESTFNIKLPTHDAIIEFARTFIARGVKMVCVSMGARGAIFITDAESIFAPAYRLDVKAVQGAGDAMVAGLALALTDGITAPKDLLHHAMAAAAATVTREGTQMCDRAGFEHFLCASS